MAVRMCVYIYIYNGSSSIIRTVHSPVLGRAVGAALYLVPGSFRSVRVASHLHHNNNKRCFLVSEEAPVAAQLIHPVCPYVGVAQEEQLVVAQSDSRQQRLFDATSALTDPPPVRLQTQREVFSLLERLQITPWNF